MADRVYPSSKPNPHPPQSLHGGGATTGGPPSFPPTKAQQYGATRPQYRPTPLKERRRSRSCCYSCCLWLTIIFVAIILLAAIACGVFYFIYHPKRPTFTLASLRLSALNVTAANALTSRLDVNVSAHNPNSKLVYLYDDVSISVLSSDTGVDIGDGSFPGFVQVAGDARLLSTTVSTTGQTLDSSAASDLKKKTSLGLEIDLDTKAGVKIGSLKTKKVGIKVKCTGVSVAVPKGKAAPAVSSPGAACKVKIRVKIWKWYI